MITKEYLDNYAKLQYEVEVKACEILNRKIRIEKDNDYSSYDGKFMGLSFSCGKVYVYTYEDSRCYCCGGVNHTYVFPERYFFDEDWDKKLKLKMKAIRDKENYDI